MRYLLASLFLAVNSGALAQSRPELAPDPAALAVPHLTPSREAEPGARAGLRLLDSSADGESSRHGDGASMSPMWIMMGVMMVGMMVVLGARMMHVHAAASVQPAAHASPLEAAIPPGNRLAPGG